MPYLDFRKIWKKKSFETKLEELEKLVKEIESGEVPLEEVIEKFNQAMTLANECDKKLKDATKAVQKIINENGEEVSEN